MVLTDFQIMNCAVSDAHAASLEKMRTRHEMKNLPVMEGKLYRNCSCKLFYSALYFFTFIRIMDNTGNKELVFARYNIKYGEEKAWVGHNPCFYLLARAFIRRACIASSVFNLSFSRRAALLPPYLVDGKNTYVKEEFVRRRFIDICAINKTNCPRHLLIHFFHEEFCRAFTEFFRFMIASSLCCKGATILTFNENGTSLRESFPLFQQ